MVNFNDSQFFNTFTFQGINLTPPKINLMDFDFFKSLNNLFTNFNANFTMNITPTLTPAMLNAPVFTTINANFNKLNTSMNNIGNNLDIKMKNVALPKVDTSLIKFNTKLKTATQGIGKIPKSNLQAKFITLTNDTIKEINAGISKDMRTPVMTEIKNVEYASTNTLNAINRLLPSAKTQEEKLVIQQAVNTSKNIGTQSITKLQETLKFHESDIRLKASDNITKMITEQAGIKNEADKILLNRVIQLKMDPSEKTKILTNPAYIEALNARNDDAGVIVKGIVQDYIEPWTTMQVESEYIDTPNKQYLVYKKDSMTPAQWNYLVQNKFVSDIEKQSGEMIAFKNVGGKTTFQTLVEFQKLNPNAKAPLPELTTAPMGGVGETYKPKPGIFSNDVLSKPTVTKFETQTPTQMSLATWIRQNPNTDPMIGAKLFATPDKNERMYNINVNQMAQTIRSGQSYLKLTPAQQRDDMGMSDSAWDEAERRVIDLKTNQLIMYPNTGITAREVDPSTGRVIEPQTQQTPQTRSQATLPTAQQLQLFPETTSMMGATGILNRQMASQPKTYTDQKITPTTKQEPIQGPAVGIQGLRNTPIVQNNPTILAAVNTLSEILHSEETYSKEMGFTKDVEISRPLEYSPLTTLYQTARIFATEGVFDPDRAMRITTEEQVTPKGLQLVKETAPLIAMGITNIGADYGISDQKLNKIVLQSGDTGSLQMIAMSNPKWVSMQAYAPQTAAFAANAYGIEGIKEAQRIAPLNEDDIRKVGLSTLGGLAKGVLNTEITGVPGIDNAFIPITLLLDVANGAKGVTTFAKEMKAIAQSAKPFGQLGDIYSAGKQALKIDYSLAFKAATQNNPTLSASLGDFVGNAILGNTKLSGVTMVDVPTVFNLAVKTDNPIISKNGMNVIGKQFNYDSTKVAKVLNDQVGLATREPGSTLATVITPTDIRNFISKSGSMSDNARFEESVLQKFNELQTSGRAPVLPIVKDYVKSTEKPTRTSFGALPQLRVTNTDIRVPVAKTPTWPIPNGKVDNLDTMQLSTITKQTNQGNNVFKLPTPVTKNGKTYTYVKVEHELVPAKTVTKIENVDGYSVATTRQQTQTGKLSELEKTSQPRITLITSDDALPLLDNNRPEFKIDIPQTYQKKKNGKLEEADYTKDLNYYVKTNDIYTLPDGRGKVKILSVEPGFVRARTASSKEITEGMRKFNWDETGRTLLGQSRSDSVNVKLQNLQEERARTTNQKKIKELDKQIEDTTLYTKDDFEQLGATFDKAGEEIETETIFIPDYVKVGNKQYSVESFDDAMRSSALDEILNSPRLERQQKTFSFTEREFNDLPFSAETKDRVLSEYPHLFKQETIIKQTTMPTQYKPFAQMSSSEKAMSLVDDANELIQKLEKTKLTREQKQLINNLIKNGGLEYDTTILKATQKTNIDDAEKALVKLLDDEDKTGELSTIFLRLNDNFADSQNDVFKLYNMYIEPITTSTTPTLPKMIVIETTPQTNMVQQALEATKKIDYKTAAQRLKLATQTELKTAEEFMKDVPMKAISQLRTANVKESTVKLLEQKRKIHAITELENKGLSKQLEKFQTGKPLERTELKQLFENRREVQDAMFIDVAKRDETDAKIFKAWNEELAWNGATDAEKAAFRKALDDEIKFCQDTGVCSK